MLETHKVTKHQGKLLPTAREGNAFAGVSQSFCPQSATCYPVTAHPCYGVVATHPTRMLSCYCPQRSWGKVIFSQASVILFTGGLPQCMLGCHMPPPQDQAGTPKDQAPPRPGTPPGPGTLPGPGRHPPEQRILGDTVNERVVCILLECNLVSTFYHKPLCFCWLKQSWYLMKNGWRTIWSHWLYNYLWHLVLIKFSSLTVSGILNIDVNLCYLII